MPIKIEQDGEGVLRQVAKPIAKKDIPTRKIKLLIERMKKALAQEEYGVAIAAPQVGASVRLFVVAGKVFKKDDGETPADKVFINPQISRLSRAKKEMHEGCLSVRGKYGVVLRHQKATLKAQNESGETLTYHGSGLVAQIFQHETDHLEGLLYTDKALAVSNEEEVRAQKKAAVAS